MARKTYGKTRTIPYRRKREGKTSYKRRLALLKSGTSRLIVRKSLNTIIAQVVEYKPDGDRVLLSATSRELPKMGWKMHKANTPSAYLTGLLLGMKAKKKKISKAVLDLGLQTPLMKGKLFATVKGAVDAGMDIKCGEEALPAEDRIAGAHIAEYASKLKQDKEKYNKQFSGYLKQGATPEDIGKSFDEMKKKILAL
jgi:large subunit ribosomal protein L18